MRAAGNSYSTHLKELGWGSQSWPRHWLASWECRPGTNVAVFAAYAGNSFEDQKVELASSRPGWGWPDRPPFLPLWSESERVYGFQALAEELGMWAPQPTGGDLTVPSTLAASTFIYTHAEASNEARLHQTSRHCMKHVKHASKLSSAQDAIASIPLCEASAMERVSSGYRWAK